MHYVIAYDVVDNRRRNRLAKFLESQGRRVQKSVFECDLSSEELQKLSAQVKKFLKISEDRCHIYRLCGECLPKRIALGRAIEPDLKEIIVV